METAVSEEAMTELRSKAVAEWIERSFSLPSMAQFECNELERIGEHLSHAKNRTSRSSFDNHAGVCFDRSCRNNAP